MAHRANGKSIPETLSYETWLTHVPETIAADPLWKMDAYRKALYLYDLAWKDGDKLMRDPRGHAVTRQLVRAVGSISANIEEGYDRGYSKDRDYFVRVALGSARETRGWFLRSRHLLSTRVLTERLDLTSEIIALLVTELKRKRRPH
jgi:four helix bundle protein